MILINLKPRRVRTHSVASKELMAERRRQWWAGASEQQRAITRQRIRDNHARPNKGKVGPASSAWKGGRFTTKRDGYVFVWAPDHPHAKRSGQGGGGYVLEHRLVMEKILGRYLHPDEDVNHRNGVKDDNRPDNLRLVSHFAHFEEHGCPNCNFKFLTR